MERVHAATGALGRGVDSGDRAAHHGLAGAEIDDSAATVLAHDRVRRLVGEDRGLEVRIDEEVDVLAGDMTGIPR
jgi:hypothetical protein